MVKILQRLKAEAIWVDPEDKQQFIRILFDRSAETGEKQTQESIFKFLLDEFFKNRGDKYAKIRSSRPG